MNLRELNRQVLRHESGGKIIWQPRIGCWYGDKIFNGEALPAPFTNMNRQQIYRKLGCSARPYEYGGCIIYKEHPEVRVEKTRISDVDEKTVISTPVGNQTRIDRKTESSSRKIKVKWEIETEEEMKVAIWRENNCSWGWSQSIYEELEKEWGDLGLPTVNVFATGTESGPRVNIQDLYINKMGVEKTVYALYDWPSTVEEYFEARNQSYDRLIDVLNKSPIESINFGDNLHCGTLPADLFKKYVLPEYQRRCAKLHKAGKFVSAHWDGDVKAYLPYAKETGLDGIEAITPKPQGDVTLEEMKHALGDELFLLDGIPAILFDETYPVSMLKEFTHKLIELFAPRLVLGISDEISSTGNIDRIIMVQQIVDEFNSKT